MNTLEKYQISFFTKIFFVEKWLLVDSVNPWLSSFISDHNTIDRAEDLLDDINLVLDGTLPLGGGQTQSLYMALFTREETKIYKDLEDWEENNDIDPNFILPTTDFKEIIEAWIGYLIRENSK